MTEIEDKVTLSRHINETLGDYEPCTHHLPLDPASDDLFCRLGDGFILCGLINAAAPGTLSERSLHRDVVTAYGEAALTDEQRRENLVAVLAAAKEGLGIAELGDLTPDVLLTGSDHGAILTLLWGVLRTGVLRDINVECCPELVLLLEDHEEMSCLLSMKPDRVLQRWVNYHLTKADDFRARRLQLWSTDLCDCECYALLLRQLVAASGAPVPPNLLDFGYTCRLSLEQKAQAVLAAAQNELGVHPLLQPAHISSGHEALNVIFAGQLFNAVSGLSLNHHVREHVKESINELIFIQKEQEVQEREEKKRAEREKQEQLELEIAREKERQFRELEAEEARLAEAVRAEAARVAAEQEAELEIARQKERQFRELEAEEARLLALKQAEERAQAEREWKEAAEAAQVALQARKKEEQEEQRLREEEEKELQRQREAAATASKVGAGGESLTGDAAASTSASALLGDDVSPLQQELSSSSERVVVVEEAWENQTYLPVRGWGAPRSAVHPFSDKSGTRQVTFAKYPSVAGWEWLSHEADPWQVDHSRAFGDTDDEGWCYDSSFEKILEAIRLGITSGENKTTNLARRRRLLRTRVCSNPQALQEHRLQQSYLAGEQRVLEGALARKQQEFEHICSYEAERVQVQQISRTALLAEVSLGHESFVQFRAELRKLEVFLAAQAEAEFQHARRLEGLQQAHQPSVEEETDVDAEQQQQQQASSGDMTRPRASTTEHLVSRTLEFLAAKDEATAISGARDQSRATTANVKKASFQFFTGFSDFNRSGAVKHRNFGAFIQESVLGDVRVLASELDEAIKTAKHHLKFVEEHKGLVAGLGDAFSALRRAYVVGLRRCKTKLSVVNSKLRGGDVFTAPSSSALPGASSQSGAAAAAAAAVAAGTGAATEKEGGEGGAAGSEVDKSSTPSVKEALDCDLKTLMASGAVGAGDTHLCFSHYKALARTYAGHLQTLALAAAASTAHTSEFSLKIRQIFVISMQLCCHEKSKIYSSDSDLMKCTSSNFQLWNNAVNVKEFQQKDRADKQASGGRRHEDCAEDEHGEKQEDTAEQDDVIDEHHQLQKQKQKQVVFTSLLHLGAQQQLLQTPMRFTTFRDARKISQGELDAAAPTVVSDTMNLHVSFGEKGHWARWSAKEEASGSISTSTSTSTTSSSSSTGSSHAASPQALPGASGDKSSAAVKSRFSSFFSPSKSKPSASPLPPQEEKVEGSSSSKSTVEEDSSSGEAARDQDTPPEATATATAAATAASASSSLHDAAVYEARALVSSDGVLHLFGVPGAGAGPAAVAPVQPAPEEEEEEVGCCSDSPPLKSLLLEDCHIIFHDRRSSKFLSFAIEIYPKKQVGGKRVADGLVLLPGSEAQARQWVSLLCSPVCGASLLVPLAGIDLEIATFGDEGSGHASSTCEEVDLSFITYEADTIKPAFALV